MTHKVIHASFLAVPAVLSNSILTGLHASPALIHSQAMSDKITLFIVLGSVSAFILVTFILMVSCFPWRRRRAHRGIRTNHDRIVEARLAARIKEIPRSYTRQDRWTHSSKSGGVSRDIGGVDEAGRHRLTDETNDDTENPFSDEQANSTEWGATVNEDGTRSYLNGWCA